MEPNFWIYQIPLWAIFVLTILVGYLSISIGSWIGKIRRQSKNHESDASVGTIIGATLGLLAFLLTFILLIASQYFESRNALLLEEVNAIDTVYLRADLIKQPIQNDIKKLLREYVDLRILLVKEKSTLTPEKFNTIISQTTALQNQMWDKAVLIYKTDPNSLNNLLLIDCMNKMFDLQTTRLAFFSYHIPFPIWNIMSVIVILSMFLVGYQAGLSGKSNIKIDFVLILAFASVFLLIADIDRTMEGKFQVRQQPMLELQQRMQI